MSGKNEPVTDRRTVLAVIAVIVAIAGTLAVVAAAFVLSYDATRAVAEAAHIKRRYSGLMPASIDGAMLVGTVHVVVMKIFKRSPIYPATVVAVGVLVSMLCNGLHALSSDGRLELHAPIRVAVATVPALMLALCVHLLADLIFLGVNPPKPAIVPPVEAPSVVPAVEPAPAPATLPPTSAPAAPRKARKPRIAVPDSRGDVAVEAELLTRLAALTRELGRYPNRDEIKERLSVSTGNAEALRKVIRLQPELIPLAPEASKESPSA